jgi:ATP-binding cassette subfamily B protein
MGLTVPRINRAILDRAARIPRSRTILEQALVRISRNRLLIRVMDLQAEERRRFDGAVSAYFRASCETFFLRDIAAVLPPLLGIGVIVLVVGVDSAFIHTPPVILMGAIYLFVALTRQMAVVADQTGGLMQVQAAFDQAADLVFSMDGADRSRAFQEARETPRPSARAAGPAPDIRLRGVTYRWPGARDPLFDGLDLQVPAASRFGIVGPNGSGKTTLLHLILGLEEPQAGEILVGGMPPREYAARGGPIGYVGTENLLILGTLRDNLAYGLAGAPGDAELRQALGQVGLGPWLDGLSLGLDHPVGENEEGLSSGQKQRLSLARALLRRPALLVLDEASANIDTRSELELVSLLDGVAADCTILIVSHKPGILTGIDHRLELPEFPHDL